MSYRYFELKRYDKVRVPMDPHGDQRMVTFENGYFLQSLGLRDDHFFATSNNWEIPSTLVDTLRELLEDDAVVLCYDHRASEQGRFLQEEAGILRFIPLQEGDLWEFAKVLGYTSR